MPLAIFNQREVFLACYVRFMSFVGNCFRACTNPIIPDFFKFCSKEFVYGVF